MAGSGCTETLALDTLHSPLREYFSARGIDVDAIACRGELPRRAGAEVRCLVEVMGESVPVDVVVTDADGSLSIRPLHATLVTAELEPEIAQTLHGEGYDVAHVRCEGAVWVARPHAEHHCEVVVATGERFAWRGVFSGRGAEHRVHLAPHPSSAGGSR